ncbi:MFS transporter [Paraburkholderia guartelaensis]|uniref:MFS transporter n=1 Tax=Paraburkholderia guartelaensis TaxID=2546446 RepID=A0A4R5L4L6_9BURK|nr:MFS transporter [Paraburkholderia guartelaensis]TDG02804.1 MFS transporter [Paraburkholderia guartelaensis]
MQNEPQITVARQIPRSVWILGCVSLFMDISSEIIHSLLPMFLLATLGVSAGTIGLIEGIAEATAPIVKVFSGALSDYLGNRKWLAVAGYSLGAMSKPLFAVAPAVWVVVAARIIDRIGKGIRGAPRDALVADVTPQHLRGAAFGLRQALDTVGAFLGPLLAVLIMLVWADNFRLAFWLAVIPGVLAVGLLAFGVREPVHEPLATKSNPVRLESLRDLGSDYWWVAGIGAVFALARFSEAFLVLRAMKSGIPIALVPLVMVVMNIVYALSAYPFGKLADTMSHTRLLVAALIVLIGGDLVLANGTHWSVVVAGVALWGLHMGMSQGLLATMVAHTAPAHLRGTAFGLFNLLGGIVTLVSSVIAGQLWERLGAATTFYAGAAFSVVTVVLLVLHPTPAAGQAG